MINRVLSRFFCTILFLVFILGSHPANAQTLRTNNPIDPAGMEAFFDPYLAAQMELYHIPGVVNCLAPLTGG